MFDDFTRLTRSRNQFGTGLYGLIGFLFFIVLEIQNIAGKWSEGIGYLMSFELWKLFILVVFDFGFDTMVNAFMAAFWIITIWGYF